MPLHGVVGDGQWELECFEQFDLLGLQAPDTCDGFAIDLDAMLLDLAQQGEDLRGESGCPAALSFCRMIR